MSRSRPADLDAPLLPRRALVVGGGVLFVLVSAYVVYDHLVVTDRERIEALVDHVTGEIDDGDEQALLAAVDLDAQPLETRVYGEEHTFEPFERAALDARLHHGLSLAQGARFSAFRRRVEVRGRDATVDLQLVSGRGAVNTSWTLVKIGDRWLLSSVSVH